MGFARETISVFGDWGFWGKLDMPTATGDEGGAETVPAFLQQSDLEAQAYSRFSCVFKLQASRPASEVVTDILPRAVNADASTLQLANGFSLGRRHELELSD